MRYTRFAAAALVMLGVSRLPALAQQSNAGGELTAAEFLERVRAPFGQRAWGRFAGRVTHVRNNETKRVGLELAVVFGVDDLRARLLLNASNLYEMHLRHENGRLPQVELTLPENEAPEERLFDLGITAQDITFSFIYWELRAELPRDDVRRHVCRVMDLEHPGKGQRARVWFSAEHYFPLRVQWLGADTDEVVRELDVTSFKKHPDGLWFMKSLKLQGPDWKTMVRFEDAELHPVTGDALPEDTTLPPGE